MTSKVVEAPELKRGSFVGNLFSGLKSLWDGMNVTFGYLVHPSTVVTQQYPENRATLKMFDRFRAQLVMPHDEKGHHKCTGCEMCADACPNGSLDVITRKNPVTGKKEINRYIWRMDSCTFCNACVQVCPHFAIEFKGNFESSVYDRRLFVYTLNKYAGPASKDLAKLTDPEELKKQMTAISGAYEAEVPMAGKSMAGLAAGKMTKTPEEKK